MLKFNLRKKAMLAAEGNPSIPPPSIRENLKDALIDSLVVGGIAASSSFIADPEITLKVFVVSFSLAFLIKLRDLRNID